MLRFDDDLRPPAIRKALKTEVIGRIVDYHSRIDSTQDAALRLALNAGPEGTLVLSEAQARGRGRFNRLWISGKGGLYFSFILRPVWLMVNDASRLTLLVSLAVKEAIEQETGVACGLKWPNDIYLGEKKLAGILCELNSKAGKVDFVICGAGVNVNNTSLPVTATSLFLQQREKISRLKILVAALERIEYYYLSAQKKGFAGILRRWRRACIIKHE